MHYKSIIQYSEVRLIIVHYNSAMQYSIVHYNSTMKYNELHNNQRVSSCSRFELIVPSFNGLAQLEGKVRT